MMQTSSVPVWLVIDGDSKPSMLAGRDAELYPQLEPADLAVRRPLFRGVPPTRFLAVLTTGVDVQPTDAPIYCSDFDRHGSTAGPLLASVCGWCSRWTGEC